MLDKNIAIEFDGVGKQYRLGLVGTGSLQHDLNRWWQTAILRKEDPYLKIGEVNDRSKKGTSEYVWALKDISFKVEQGDVVGIIGKNGAGKSTLLKLLSHITAPSVGHISYRGRIASLLEVGTGFHPEMTARQNIYMNGSIMGMTRHEITSKLDEIVDFAGIERYLDTPVKRFSSGMTVRLGFAVAAFLEPEILVVDEVLAVGDAEFQKKAIGKMKDVSLNGGRTVLFVSHNMAAVRSLCKNGILLSNGQLDYMGTAQDCVDKYLENNISTKEDFNFHDSKRLNNRAYISDFRFVDKNGDFIKEFSFNDILRFCISIKANESCNITTRIAIFDKNETRIIAIDTQDIVSAYKIDAGKEITLIGELKEPLNLKPGTYSVNLSIRQGADLLDHVKDATSFTIREEDFYGYGRYSISDMPLCLRHFDIQQQKK